MKFVQFTVGFIVGACLADLAVRAYEMGEKTEEEQSL